MLHYYVHRKNRGFTLTEMLATMIIAGILFAVATPSFLGLFNNSKVKSGLEQLQGALTEAQRQAMRNGKTCQVKLDTEIIDGVPRKVVTINDSIDDSGCLLSKRILSQGVSTASTSSLGNPPKISFSHKGNTPDSGTIVLYSSNSSGEKRCLAISNGLGIMRTGIYNSDTSSITADNCKTSD